MPKYKTERLVQFVEGGTINIMDYEEFKDHYENLKTDDWKAVFSVLYFTGCRPVEVAKILARDFDKSGRTIWLSLKASKNGRDRKVPLDYDILEVKELYQYSRRFLPPQYIFSRLRVVKRPNDKIYYYLKKQGVKIRPYFLRHNRFSIAFDRGADLKEIQYIKGSKTLASVEPYTHLPSKRHIKLKKFTR